MNPTIRPNPDPAAKSLARLRPRIAAHFSSFIAQNPAQWAEFNARLEQHFPRLFNLLVQVYGGQYDFFYHLEALLEALVQAWIERPAGLKALDQARLGAPDWFQSNQMVGGVCYVDLFAGDLAGIRARIPYFKELGLTYLHLMPLFLSPEGENDGGYAISSYRQVDPKLGTIADLSGLAEELRSNGISLVLDFVFNHTAHEHEWAVQARAGDPEYSQFYYMFPNREMPDAYERTLREIFPDEHPGAFTWFADIGQWVWTTFHSYQWDLNYSNPAVFIGMAKEMLALANAGVEVLRLDAVAFIWKKLGTGCENLPEAHLLIQAFNACASIAAPALLFKSEAIVHPDDVARYISAEECQISYNPLLMALLWETLATRQVKLLQHSLRDRFAIRPGCAWVNYVRVHDDIGWTFSDDDARSEGIDGYSHRKFLNAFYTGRFPGSFGRGLPFQENPKTGDCRISGTCASLAGLEKALHEETEKEAGLAVGRILLIHAIILTIGGIPLLYLGDELATLNDYSYRLNPAKSRDSRWVHRPQMDWARAEQRHDPATLPGKVFSQLKKLIALRKNNPLFYGSEAEIIDTTNPHVFGYLRGAGGRQALILANFSEQVQPIPANLLRLYGLGTAFTDLVSGKKGKPQDLSLAPYQLVCLQAA